MLVSRTDSCNVEIVSSRTPTNVTSPGYPFMAYPNNLHCWWRIDASDSGNSVIVRVLDSYIESSTNCAYDSLSFYDGRDATGPSLGRLCGQNRTSVISSGRSIYIVFKTDGSNQYKGFLLELYETTRCGGALTATPDETNFVSPGFPYQYLNNMNCTWFLTSENENDTIVVEFDQLQLEGGRAGCLYDYVSVYNDHENHNEQFLGQFCGSSTPTIQSSRNKLRIDFKTDLSGVLQGFSLNYKTVTAGDCNLTMPADSNPIYFVSPGYPDAYDNDLECVWQMVSTGQQYIQIDVIGSEIEGNYPLCSNDSVTVYEGRDLKAPEVGKFCGNSTPSFISNARAMTVSFTTDGEDVGKGFRIRYRSLDAPVTTVSPSPDRRCGSTALSAVGQGQYLESPRVSFGLCKQ
ncbi:deleted in malignant brain tumors 1 protein-like [Haliotis rubra]|uniref:deleted in malignant brain tumors 1 protein-like n=1 Tax=Haliotis rubra TaxID=36100 RepID=UPI001EE5C239|nr:deleted in malignant brain tumors 1 protein-like [Haliotis rubra]